MKDRIDCLSEIKNVLAFAVSSQLDRLEILIYFCLELIFVIPTPKSRKPNVVALFVLSVLPESLNKKEPNF